MSAANLASRYLTSRRLPDSAIDLIDEASAAVRVTRDSQPESIDKLSRAKLQLEIELTALTREFERNKAVQDNETNKNRIEEIKVALAAIEDELQPIVARYQAEKDQANQIQIVKKKIEELESKAADATRRYDLATAADLNHYAIPDLKNKLELLEGKKRADDLASTNAGGAMAGSVVTSEAIAKVVSMWSGIPLTSLKVSHSLSLAHSLLLVPRDFFLTSFKNAR